ncbi:MAG: hypothetical protein PHF98_04415 [Patescibacteria group bacterium]|nr:hypothetical protein [Patescibacteria group bacterium]
MILRIIVHDLIAPYLNKRQSDDVQWRTIFTVTYWWCIPIAFTFAALSGGWSLDKAFGGLVAVGAVNAFGSYLFWASIRVNLTRTSLFLVMSDIGAVGLALAFLGEAGMVRTGVWVGSAVSVSAALLLVVRDVWRERSERQAVPVRFYGTCIGAMVIFAFSLFLIRLSAAQEIALGTFLGGWYTGTGIVATVLFLCTRRSRAATGQVRLVGRETFWSFVMALSFVGSVCLTFWAYRSPIVAVQPFFMVMRVAGPLAIGLIWYREHKTLDRLGWYALAIGIVGVLIIGVSFQ